ncbi:hypothetical protein [Glaciimonas immobilis]|uniref:Uncharacterized protein n=1 Tax=Glaciimonas immobilis TaxID=728004 RepID=A0A840RTW1_9BURK|nr:hypothetical protein [Glaciimonas immobilis]KAF3996404.1 hypothetical protein HAV38_17240 [Glaciimonas immobilis]MBB5201265.1 hypothetical protein [Glaciimonas immobilis]
MPLPPMARTALDQYLVQRRLSVLSALGSPKLPLIANLDKGGIYCIKACLWHIIRKFATAPDLGGP